MSSKSAIPGQEGSNADDLFATVVQGGYCIGCGNCAFASGGAIRMALDSQGFVQPLLTAPIGEHGALDTICPFSNAVPNETQIAEDRPWGETSRDERTGRWSALYAGHVTDEAYRHAGGSGGLTTWFLEALLASGEVDYILHVKPVDSLSDPEGRLFRYRASSTAEELRQGRKSRYYPVDLSEAYDIMISRPGRCAVVGIPCFAKAIRLMQRNRPEIAERVAFVVGLVCGHLKSRSFAEYLGWLQGVHPKALRYIDFRVKLPGGSAAQYTVEARDSDSARRGLPLKEYFGTTWDLGFMKYAACEFCDDVFAETADVVFGDAWIPPFQESWLGSNVVLARHPVASRLLAEGVERGVLTLETITIDQMAASQAGGLRHRRDGLAYRLSLMDRVGKWRPRKRFESLVPLSGQRKRIYELRTALARRTARAFALSRESPSLLSFYFRVSGGVFHYYRINGGIRQAITQSVPFKALARTLKRLQKW